MRIVTSKTGCKTARELARIIGCPCRYNPPKNKKVFVVPYGTAVNGANLNRKLVLNKKDALYILKEYGLPVPQIFEKDGVANLTDGDFPLIGRKNHHTNGRDVRFIKTKAEFTDTHDYYLKYIPKWSEYRVHVMGGQAVSVVAKTHDDRDAAKKNPVWNHNTGWKQFTYDGEHTEALKQLGIRAVMALGYDFGAVDIIRREDKFYILEVNSAPGLIDMRIQLYADFFKQKEREWKYMGRPR